MSGNGISIIGDSSSSDAATEVSTPAASSPDPAAVTSGDDGVGSGTQALVDVAVPVTVGGNAQRHRRLRRATRRPEVASGDSGTAESGTASTSGEDSILGGTQVLGGIDLPVTVGGNAISVIGDSESSDAATAVESPAAQVTALQPETSGEDSILGGTQVVAGTAVTVVGNAISVSATARGPALRRWCGRNRGRFGDDDGDGGLLGGTQLLPDCPCPSRSAATRSR